MSYKFTSRNASKRREEEGRVTKHSEVAVIDLTSSPPDPRGRSRTKGHRFPPPSPPANSSPSPPPSPSDRRRPAALRRILAPELNSRGSSANSAGSSHSLKRPRSVSPSGQSDLPRSLKRPRPDSRNPPQEAFTLREEVGDNIQNLKSDSSDEGEEDEDEPEEGDGDSDKEESRRQDVNALPGKKYDEIVGHCLGDGVVIIPELKALICTHCHRTVSGAYLIRHFKKESHPRTFSGKDITRTLQELGIAAAFRPKPPLAGCLVPSGLRAIPYWKCGHCHTLFNPTSNGYERHSCSRKYKVEVKVCHWTDKKVFEVVTTTSDQESVMTVEQWADRKLLKLDEHKESRVIMSTTPAAQIHPFLIRSGWIEFFRPMELDCLEMLKRTTSLPNPDDPMRVLLHKVFEDLHLGLKNPSCSGFRSHLFATVGDPSDSNTKNEAHDVQVPTHKRYSDQAARFLSFYTETRDMDPETRPYFTTTRHDKAWDTFRKHFTSNGPKKLSPDHWTSDELYRDSHKAIISVLHAFFCDFIEVPGIPLPQTTTEGPISPTEEKNKPQLYHPVSTFTMLSSTSPGQVLARPRDATRMVAALQWITRHTLFGFLQLRREDPEVASRRMQEDVEEQSKLWLREQKGTVFSWIRNVMRIGSACAGSEDAIERFVYSGADTFIIEGQKVSLTAWKKMVVVLLDEFRVKFSQLCDFLGAVEGDLELPQDIYEHNTCTIVNYWAGTESANKLWEPIKSFVKKALSNSFYHVENQSVVPIPGAFGNYRALATSFLKSLQAALYFTGGQPPRGDNDLWALQFRNTSTRGRNLFYYDGSLIYVSAVNKTIWKYGRDAGIPHIFPWHNPSKLLLKYLVYIRPLEILLADENPNSCTEGSMEAMASFVFQNFGQKLGTSQFSAEMKVKTQKLLELPHEGLTTMDIRQSQTFIGRRYILPAMRDQDQGYGAIMDLQAGHSSATAGTMYGVEVKTVPFSVETNSYLKYKVVCYSFHHFYQIADQSDYLSKIGVDLPPVLSDKRMEAVPPTTSHPPSTPTKTKNPHTEVVFNSGAVKKMMELLTPHLQAVPALSPSVHTSRNSVTHMPTELLTALLQIGRYPFKSEAQATAAIAVHSRREDILCVLPTGGGKSLVFQATAATGKGVVVTVVPFRALAEDQVKAAIKIGIRAEVFNPQMIVENCPNILCAVVETALGVSFQRFMRQLESKGRIQAIILDEAHLFLSPDLLLFRPLFQDLPHVFRKFNAPLVFLTGSLPPSDELRLLGIFNRRTIQTIRQPCKRKNISYRIDTEIILDWASPRSVGNYIWEKAKGTAQKGGRVLVFLPTKDMIKSIVEQPNRSDWLVVTAAVKPIDQASVLASWGTHPSRSILLATSVIGTGVDLPTVRMVIHVGLPVSFRDYFQQTGRGGRDGLLAVALLNPTPPPFGVKIEKEDAVDHQTMQKFATDDECRRLTIDGHMDGTASICLGGDMALCDVCDSIKSQCLKEGLEQAEDDAYWAEVGDIGQVQDHNTVSWEHPSLSDISSPSPTETFPYHDLGSQQRWTAPAPLLDFESQGRIRRKQEPTAQAYKGKAPINRIPQSWVQRPSGIRQEGSLLPSWPSRTSQQQEIRSHSHQQSGPMWKTKNMPSLSQYSSQSASTGSSVHGSLKIPSSISVNAQNRGAVSQKDNRPSRQAETRSGSLTESVQRVRKESWDLGQASLTAYNTQIDLMERLGGIKCVFCLLTYNRRATHTTEQCRSAQQLTTIDDISDFPDSVRQWSRRMPFYTGGSVNYCAFCRFPQVIQFHVDSPRGPCRYNDVLNRTAWALWHNPTFHGLIYEYSIHSIDVPNMEPLEFQRWLLQESDGITHLFRIFAKIVD